MAPTYECKCKECDNVQEYWTTISKMDKDLPKVCSGCDSEGTLERIFPTGVNKSGFVLKGSGWFGSSKSDSKKGY